MKILSGPYTRVYLKPAQFDQFMLGAKSLLNAKIDFSFQYEPIQATVYGISFEGDKGGYFSLAATEIEIEDLPDTWKYTRLTVAVDDAHEAVETLRAQGFKVIQEVEPAPTGFQSRVALSPEFYVEIVQWVDEIKEQNEKTY